MLQEITQRVFCSRVFSLASLFEVLLILKFFDSVRYLLVLVRVSDEFTYMGFSLLLVVHFMGFKKKIDLCNKPVHLSLFTVMAIYRQNLKLSIT